MAHGDHDETAKQQNDDRLRKRLAHEHGDEQGKDDRTCRDCEPQMFRGFDVLGEHPCHVSGEPPYSWGMSDQPVNFSVSGPPETVLPPPEPEAALALSEALSQSSEFRRAAVASVVARWPRYLDAWARLGDLGRDDVERYAYYRIGYHRGLDTLRANGWRGSGFVRWRNETNRGFLRAMRGLTDMAAAIGEADEAERCRLFILQLDPNGIPPTG